MEGVEGGGPVAEAEEKKKFSLLLGCSNCQNVKLTWQKIFIQEEKINENTLIFCIGKK